MYGNALVVHVELVDIATGGWCDTCLLPSMLHVTAAQHWSYGVSLFEFDHCPDCGGHNCPAVAAG